MNSLKLKNSFLLLLTAFIWGIAFVVQDSGGNALGPFTFNCLRAFIGGIVLLPTDQNLRSHRSYLYET